MRSKLINLYGQAGVKKTQGSPDSHVSLRQLYWKTELWEGDTGHWGYPDFPPDRDCGGNFGLQGLKKVNPWIKIPKIIRPGAPYKETYEGYVTPDLDILGFVGGGWLADPSSWGASAYNRMRPDKPSFQGLNALYELKDVPGMLKQRFTPDLRGAGNYWLALKFGWEPLLRDCRNLVTTQMGAQDRLKQLIRDNGRPVRRKIMLEDVILSQGYKDVYTYPVAGMYPILPTQFYVGQSVTKLNLYDYRRTWASAQFRYWLPEGPRDIVWTARMLGRIFGLNPTPSVVYNAMPWSWLVDWFTSAGDVVANMSAGVADRLAADYYYLMQERGAYSERESQCTFMREADMQPITVSGKASENWYHKRRVRGDPFGLNTSPNNLSGMQLSILGALGLSRLPR
jgi:hypothetical protein